MNSIDLAEQIPFQIWLLLINFHCLLLLHLIVLALFARFASLIIVISFLFFTFCFLVAFRRLLKLARISSWLLLFLNLWYRFHLKIKMFGLEHSILKIWDLDYFIFHSTTVSHSMQVQMRCFQFMSKPSCSLSSCNLDFPYQ
jgi:hypothetical protein